MENCPRYFQRSFEKDFCIFDLKDGYDPFVMRDFVNQTLLRLIGENYEGLFHLSQFEGGGSYSLLCELGLDTSSVLCYVDIDGHEIEVPFEIVEFDGHDSPNHYLWGEIAEEIGPDAYTHSKPFWEHGPRAPSKSDWEKMIGDFPTLIILQELQDYCCHSYGVSAEGVKGGELSDILAVGLSNLFEAVKELDHCCLISISNE